MFSLIPFKQSTLVIAKKHALLGLFSLIHLSAISGCSLFPHSESNSTISTTTHTKNSDSHPNHLFVKLIKNDIKHQRLLYPQGSNAWDHINFLQSEAPNHPDLMELKRLLLKALVETLATNPTNLAIAERLAVELEEQEALDSIFQLKTQRALSKQTITPSKIEATSNKENTLKSQALENQTTNQAKKKKSPSQNSTILKIENKGKTKNKESEESEENKKAEKNITNLPPLNLDDKLISNRDQKIASQISNWIPDILQQPTNLVIHAHNMKDFRWLRATLKTNIMQLKSDYNFVCDPFISPTTQPSIRVIPK